MIEEAIRFVALGDSYTIGTATAAPEDRWPDQLVERLRADPSDGRSGGSRRGTAIELVANLAVNGYTSADVIRRELPALGGLRPGFVSLLVGVNDVVQAVAPETYRANVEAILDDLLARLPSDRVLTVATPDYTVTPQGAAYGDPITQAAAIRRLNSILADVAATRGIAFVDIHDVSLGAAADRALVAGDGLHPSAAQYGLWVDRIAPVVRELLSR